ncbi:YraN family protein [Patescibacteria group bacterium]|nr:MAG: YraN family protein [Patescibacteria group bacterium]
MPSRNQKLGQWGEEQACAFLRRNGFRIIERNFHATVGEIDVVAAQGGDYYFIEVKTRETPEMATDLAVTELKKHKLEKTMRHYCYRRDIKNVSLIMAGLLVEIRRPEKKLFFRFCVYY